MLMIVFGAGASYDSSSWLRVSSSELYHETLRFRPPLANQLFDRLDFVNIASRYHRLIEILPQIQGLDGISIEEVLEGLQRESKSYVDGQKQLAAVKFYLRDVLRFCTDNWAKITRGLSNYSALLDQIARKRGNDPLALVTFNYDCLLEKALEARGLSLTTMDHYIGNPEYRIFKLHGSINWAHRLGTPLAEINSSFLIENAPSLKLADEFTFYDNSFEDLKHGQVLFPAIAIPTKGKSFECPKRHLQVLHAVIPDVTKILVIGWRAGELHFLELLKGTLGELKEFMVVAGERHEAQEIADRIRAELGLDREVSSEIAVGFSDFVKNRQGDRFFEK
jgi:hypothetical protein